MKKTLSIILILCLVIITQTGCGVTEGLAGLFDSAGATSAGASTSQSSQSASDDTSFGEDWLLNTYCYIKTFKSGQEQIIDDAFALARSYENKLSRTIASSEISTGNYSDDTKDLLDRALKFEEESHGLFCIHLGSVSELWDFSGEPRVPEQSEIDEALAKQTVDLGAIAKGYIADKTVEFLKEQGVDSAIISLGGNIVCIGNKPSGTDWQVGIEKPFTDKTGTLESRESIGTVSLGADTSVVTSGIYERCFTDEQGNFYHHILDSKTGYPCSSDIVSATIIGPSSCDCDALATIAVLMGSTAAPDFITSHGCEYVLILDSGEILTSSSSQFTELN